MAARAEFPSRTHCLWSHAVRSMKKRVRAKSALSVLPPHQLHVVWSWTLCALTVAGVWLRPSTTQAQPESRAQTPPTWAVRVDANSRCAADSNFSSTLSDPIPPIQRASVDTAELIATVDVKREGNLQHASVQVFDQILKSPAGARDLTLPMAPCRETAEALSLIISVLVEAGRAPLAPALPPPPDPPPERPEPPPPHTEPEPQPRKHSTWEGKRYAWLGPKAGHDLTLQAGVGYGVLPGAYYGGTVGWGIRSARIWPIWLSATGFLPSVSDGGRGEFSAFYGSISVCPLTGTRARWRGQLCPSFATGVLRGEGKRLPSQNERSLPIALLGLEIKGDLRIAGPLALSLTGRLEAPLMRPNFAYDRLDGSSAQIFQTAPVTLTLLGGLSLVFR